MNPLKLEYSLFEEANHFSNSASLPTIIDGKEIITVYISHPPINFKLKPVQIPSDAKTNETAVILN
jgi:hypothetical protein